MSRSRLIDLLHRAYQTCHRSATHPIFDSKEPAWLHQTTSRRQVLHNLAVAGTLAAIPLKQTPNPLHSPVTPATDRILVVGAGIAGLTAAYRLHQAGIPVDIIEASSRVGGRLRSLSKTGSSPAVVELGGEFIDSRHRTVHALAAELELEMADLQAADAGLEPEILYFQGHKVSHSWIATEFVPLAQRIAQDLTKLDRRDTTYHNPSAYAMQLDRLSLAEYLAQASIHPVLQDLIRVAYVTEYGLDTEAQSCLNMLFLIGAEVGQWSTYGVSDERYHIIGGNDQIPKRLAERLADFIETGTELESIRMTHDNRYRVSLRQGRSSVERVYEQIVLTIPFTTLRQVELAVEMSPTKRRAIDQLGYGTSTKLAIPFQERIWRTQYGSTISVYTDLDFQNTWESARYSAGTGGWVTDLRGGTGGVQLGNGSAETHAQAVVKDLEQIFPGLDQVDRGAAVRATWFTEPYALGSYSCYLPGQYTAFGGAEIERVGNIWFAGEHCSVVSQGYMDGACETAEQTAKGILASLV